MKNTIRLTLASLTRRQRFIYFLLVALKALSSLLDVAGIALIAILTGLAATSLDKTQPLVIAGLTFPAVTQEMLFVLVISVLAVFALKAIIAITLGKAITVFLARIETVKSAEIAKHMFSGDLNAISRFDKGEIAWSMLGSVSIAFSGILSTLSTFITEGVLLALIAVTFLIVDPIATIFVFGYFGLIIVIIQLVIGNALKQAGVDASEGSIQSMVVIDNSVGAFREIQIYNKQQFFLERFVAARARMAKSVGTTTFLQGMPRYVVETALMLGVVLFVGFQFLTGQLATGLVTVGVFLTGGVRVMASLLPLQNAIASAKTQTEQSRLALQLLEEIRDNESTSSTIKSSQDPQPELASTDFAALSVEMRNVSFTYPGSESPALKNASLKISGGQHVALIGPSGAGKTTIVDLILGLMSPTTGEMIIGNGSIDHATLIEKGLVSYVPQRPGVVAGTIAENVALGIDPESIDEKKILEALEKAYLLDYVSQLPEGIYASVGNQSDALSGGQIQRLGLARALYNKPKLLVLDEATSALDASSEAYIGKSIKNLGSDVTVIVIAHRLSTVQHSDNVFVVENGEISASGSFNKLRQTVPMVAEYVKLMSFDQK